MRMLVAVLRELIGLFIDDGSLALAILAVVLVAAMATVLVPNLPLAAGAILLFGCLGALIENVLRVRRR